MKKLISTALISAASILPASAQQHKHKQVRIDYNAPIADTLKAAIDKSVKKYDKAYHYPYKAVQIDTATFENIPSNGNIKMKVLARGLQQKILFNPNDRYTIKDITDNTLHELTHTLKNSPHYFPQTIPLHLGEEAIGVTGRGILIKLPNGDSTKYIKIEEAAADYLAKGIDSSYTPSGLDYVAVGYLLEQLAKDNSMSREQIAKDIATNNLIPLIKIITGKETINEETLNAVMTLFQKARNIGIAGYDVPTEEQIPAIKYTIDLLIKESISK